VYFFTVLIALENIIKIPFGSNQLGFFYGHKLLFPTIDPIDIPKNLWVMKSLVKHERNKLYK
jgi:hypothetical protein